MKHVFYPQSAFYIEVDLSNNRKDDPNKINIPALIAPIKQLFYNPKDVLIMYGRVRISDGFSKYIYISVDTNNIDLSEYIKNIDEYDAIDIPDEGSFAMSFNKEYIEQYVFMGTNSDSPKLKYVIDVDIDDDTELAPNTYNTFYQIDATLRQVHSAHGGKTGNPVKVKTESNYYSTPGSALANILAKNTKRLITAPKLKEKLNLSVDNNSPGVFAGQNFTILGNRDGEGSIGIFGDRSTENRKTIRFTHFSDNIMGMFKKTFLSDIIGQILPGLPPPRWVPNFFMFISFAGAVDTIISTTRNLIKAMKE
jgi:hypothetical protein